MPQQMPTVSTSEGDEQGGLVPRRALSEDQVANIWGRLKTSLGGSDALRQGKVSRVPHLRIQHADTHRCVRYEIEIMGEGSKARPAKCVVHREDFPKEALAQPKEEHEWLIPLDHDERFTSTLQRLFDSHEGPLTLVLTAVYDATHKEHRGYDAYRMTCWLRIPNQESTGNVAAV